MNKFDELTESILSEAAKPKVKEKMFSGLRIDPSDLSRDFDSLCNDYFDAEDYEKMEMESRGSYSSGYMQDDNWKGYLDVKITTPDKNLTKDITAMFKQFQKQLKEQRW